MATQRCFWSLLRQWSPCPFASNERHDPQFASSFSPRWERPPGDGASRSPPGEALHRRAVEQLKLFAKPPERPLGPLVSGLKSRLEFPPDAPLPALGQVAEHALALMPLDAPPQAGSPPEGPWSRRSTESERSPRSSTPARSRSRSEQTPTPPFRPEPSQGNHHEVVLRCRPGPGAPSSLSLRALARMKRRETVGPKASGTASAHPS